MRIGGFSVCAIVSTAVATVSLVFCAGRGYDLLAFAVFVSLLTSAVTLVESRRWEVMDRVLLVDAFMTFVMTCLVLLDFQFIADMGKLEGAHVEGLMYWLITFPTAFLMLAAVVNVTGAGFNRFVFPVFGAFFSIAIVTLAWVYVSMAAAAELDIVYTQPMEEAYLFMNAVLSGISAPMISRLLKGRGYRMEPREVSE